MISLELNLSRILQLLANYILYIYMLFSSMQFFRHESNIFLLFNTHFIRSFRVIIKLIKFISPFKELQLRLKFETRLKHGLFYSKLYSVLRYLSRRSIGIGFWRFKSLYLLCLSVCLFVCIQ